MYSRYKFWNDTLITKVYRGLVHELPYSQDLVS